MGGRNLFVLLIVATALSLGLFASEQNPQQGVPAPATLGLEQGILEFDTPDFKLKLVKSSQTIAALEPKGTNGFDFTPADRLENRASDRFNSLGDITLRIGRGDAGVDRAATD